MHNPSDAPRIACCAASVLVEGKDLNRMILGVQVFIVIGSIVAALSTLTVISNGSSVGLTFPNVIR